MYKHCGEQLQKVSTIFSVLGMIISFIFAFYFGVVDEGYKQVFHIGSFFLWAIGGSALSYVNGLVLYGFGELILCMGDIKTKLSDGVPFNNSGKPEEPSRDKTLLSRPADTVSVAKESSNFDNKNLTANTDAIKIDDKLVPPKGNAEGYIVCPKCGIEQRANRRVCWHCGISLADTNS